MKYLFVTFFLLLFKFSFSQKIALLDNNFKKPILYTDSVTLDQVSNHLIPIEANVFDTLYSNLKAVKELLSNNLQRAKMKSFTLKSGSTTIKVSAIKHAYGDSYDIELISKFNNLTSTYKIGENENLNKGNIKRLNKMMVYMKNASALFKSDYVELQPRYYDVVVYQ